MNRFCKLVLVGALAVVSCFVSSAQNDYRSKGYKGSVSITDHYGVWLGAETSHGYMFNRNIYLGAGIILQNEAEIRGSLLCDALEHILHQKVHRIPFFFPKFLYLCHTFHSISSRIT